MELRTVFYFKILIILSSFLTFLVFTIPDNSYLDRFIYLIFCFFYVVSCIVSFSGDYIRGVIWFRLFLDNILVGYLILFSHMDLKLSVFLFFGFNMQCLISSLINILLFERNKITGFYFLGVLFFIPLTDYLINNPSFSYCILSLCIALFVCLLDFILTKLLWDQKEYQRSIVRKNGEILQKEKIIGELNDRLKRHEVSNLLMTFSLYIMKYISDDTVDYYISRLSNVYNGDVGEVRLFTAIYEIQEEIRKRFSIRVDCNDSEYMVTRDLVQILFIFIENSAEAGADEVTVTIHSEGSILIISDNGCGFDVDRIQLGYTTKNKGGVGRGGIGLKTAIDLLREKNIGFDIKSVLSEGTTITLEGVFNEYKQVQRRFS